MRKKWIGAAAAVALVVVGAVVFTSRDSGGASDKDLIITAAVKRQTLQDKVTLSGTLGRVEQRKVNAAAEGRISRTYLDDGVDVAARPSDPGHRRPRRGRRARRLPLLPSRSTWVRRVRTSSSSSRSWPRRATTRDRSTSCTPSRRGSPSRSGRPTTTIRAAASRTAKTVTVSLQPNGNGYKIGPQNTAAVTIGPDLGTPSGPVGRAKPRQSSGGLPRLSIRSRSARRRKRAQPAQFIVQVDQDITQPIDFTVNLSGSASESDVVAPVGKITFPTGVRQVPLNIPTIADGVVGGRRGPHGRPRRR